MMNNVETISKSKLGSDFDFLVQTIEQLVAYDKLDLSNVSAANDKVNLSLRTVPKLRDFYQDLCHGIAKLFQADCAQTWGTIRITLPGQKSVPFHIDKWSGHPTDLINVWVPLTKLKKTNTLYIVSRDRTAELIDDLSKNQIDLSELEEKALIAAEPFLMSDQVLIFSNEFLHGSVLNEEKLRISLDFRLCRSSAFDGRKIIGQDYQFVESVLHEEISENKHTELAGRQVRTLLFQHNDFRHVAHHAQRQICRVFSAANDLTIVAEGSEFQGFDSFPQLELWLKDKDNPVTILMPSINCVTRNGELMSEFTHLIEKYGANIYFALENLNSKKL